MGGIPIVSEIFDGLRWLIDFFFNKSPRSVKILFFLLFLLFFGVLLNFALHLSGIHCDSGKIPVRTGIRHVGTNIAIMWETDPDRQIKGDSLSICDVHPDKCGEESQCYYLLENVNMTYRTCNVTNPAPNCLYYLSDGSCHNCTSAEKCVEENEFWIFCGTYYDICLTTPYSGGQSDTDFLTKCSNACSVPENYLWNMTTGRYDCIDLNICGDSATIELPAIDQKLDSIGYDYLYENQNYNDIGRIVSITCDDSLNPNISFFNFPIFQFKIWVLIIVIYVMFIFLTHLPIRRN